MSKFRRIAVWVICIQAFFVMAYTVIHSYQQSNSFSWVPTAAATLASKATEAPLPALPDDYTLTDPPTVYFRTVGNATCFIDGTDWSSAESSWERCRCLAGYFGADCGIPAPVWHSCRGGGCDAKRLKVRPTPRRIIHGINMNHEADFLEIRMEEIGDVIDVLILAESNVTAGGDRKPLYILPQLRGGLVQRFQHKMIHVVIDDFPERGYTDGWFADTFIRDEMGRLGLKRIHGVRDDDLFLLLDADEIPDPRVLLFLKLYDGYSEPVSLTLRWNVYGFFWKRAVPGTLRTEDVTRIVALSSMAMIRSVYDNQVMSLRRNYLNKSPFWERFNNYSRLMGSENVGEWNIGRVGDDTYAGFHCSWCYPPEGIRLKLMAAQKDDKPRWGDYPDKLRLDYIGSLIRDGRWFDDSRPFFAVEGAADAAGYAPLYVLRHPQRFAHLLQRPHLTAIGS